jgi:hypothetical protein
MAPKLREITRTLRLDLLRRLHWTISATVDITEIATRPLQPNYLRSTIQPPSRKRISRPAAPSLH